MLSPISGRTFWSEEDLTQVNLYIKFLEIYLAIFDFSFPYFIFQTYAISNQSSMSTSRYLLIPIHHYAHWTLAVLDRNRNIIEYYDSANQKAKTETAALKNLQNFIQVVIMFLCAYINIYIKASHEGLSLEPSSWQIDFKSFPTQSDSHSCGVFMLMNALISTKLTDSPIITGTMFIDFLRTIFCIDILNGCINSANQLFN